MIKHLSKRRLNPDNPPKIEAYLIKNPCTEKAKKFNQILAPQGDAFEGIIEELLNYLDSLPKVHKEKMISKKLDQMFSEGIELRL